jgi:hypothetical protein
MELNDKNRIADEWLEAAMRQSSHAEPDSGLEDRVLRRLRAVPEKTSRWQLWAPWATAAVALIAAMALLVRKPNDVPHAVIDRSPARALTEDHASNNILARTMGRKASAVAVSSNSKQSSPKLQSPRTTASAAAPKREQFPSPEPLSEQEKILIDYARNFGREAMLIARAQTELLNREALEQKESLSKNGVTFDAQPQDSQGESE